mgnify:CR=1 FL=1
MAPWLETYDALSFSCGVADDLTIVSRHENWTSLVVELRTIVLSAPELHVVVHKLFPPGEGSTIGVVSLTIVDSSARSSAPLASKADLRILLRQAK